MTEIWDIWIENENRRNTDFQKYIKSKSIKKEIQTEELIKGHLEKEEVL